MSNPALYLRASTWLCSSCLVTTHHSAPQRASWPRAGFVRSSPLDSFSGDAIPRQTRRDGETHRGRLTSQEPAVAAQTGAMPAGIRRQRRGDMSSRRFLSVMVLLCVGLLWFLSNLFSPYGLEAFAGGLVPLGVALWAFRHGRTRPLFALSLLLLLTAATAGPLGAAVRLAPGLLRGRAALEVFNGYHCAPGGIYRRDPHEGRALRPACSCQLYWNGHWWHHQTNANGYRGEAVDRADAVFLGDSMIYGHAVETEQPFPSRFAAHTGLPVANLGQQGTDLLQMWLRYRRLGTPLHPRLVFVCSHFNDVGEATFYHPAEELERFLAGPVEEDYLPRARREYQEGRRRKLEQFWNDHAALALRAGRLVHFLLCSLSRKPGISPTPESEPFVPSRQARQAPFTPWADSPEARLGWQVHARALAKLKYLCDQQGARLVLFDLGYPSAFSAAIKGVADRLGVTYVPAGQAALARALAGEETYLANDGHWSPHGCDVVARELTTALGLTRR